MPRGTPPGNILYKGPRAQVSLGIGRQQLAIRGKAHHRAFFFGMQGHRGLTELAIVVY